MGKLYAEYIRQEPEVLKRILEARKTLAEPFLALARREPAEKVFFLGSGSSWHCGLICKRLVQRITGREVVCLTSTMAADTVFPSDGLYFAVSQSGTSNSTLSLIRRIHQEGGKVIALTAETDSPVARAGDLTIPVLCGEEVIGPKSKGVLATIMTLAMLFIELGQENGSLSAVEYDTLIEQWRSACSYVGQAAQEGERFFAENREEILAASEWMLLAGSEQIGAARECALKMLETCWLPAYAYEFEEYMHGIHYTLDEHRHMFYFLAQGEDRERMMALYQFGKEQGAAGWMLELNGKEKRPQAIPGAEGTAGALSYLAFFQMLSNCCSEGRGIDCDVPRYPDFHSQMKTKTFQ